MNKHKNQYFFAILCLSVCFFSCEKSAKKDKIEPVEKLAKVTFFNSNNQKNLEILVEIVDDEYHRARGLMFRENLPDNQGMFFIFDDEAPRYFWMKNTTLSLDIIYLDATHKIIKIYGNTTPLSEELYPSELPAMYVIEVKAGFTERYQIANGDSVSWEAL
jgi:uncharacterized protein